MIAPRARAVALVVAVAVAGASLPALGQSAADKATAVALFDEGKKLVKAGKFAEACPKFELSQKLDPGVGTLGSLADCYEKAGKTASAWQTWRETAAAAAAKGQADREKYARSKASALEAKLSKLTITVPASADVAGLEVRRDGEPVIRALWGSATPVDPGAHTIEARAPGKKTYSTTVNVATDGGASTVTIPTLEPGASTEPTPPIATATPTSTPTTTPTTTATTTATTADMAPTSDTSTTSTVTTSLGSDTTPTSGSSGSNQKTAALVVGGVGVGALVVGTIFGLRAKSKNNDAAQYCRTDDPTRCSQPGVDLGNDAHSAATISTIAFVAGGLALAGGAILWFTAPKEPTPSTTTTTTPTASVNFGFGVDHGALGFTAQGAF